MNCIRTSLPALLLLAVAFACSSGSNASNQENLGQSDTSTTSGEPGGTGEWEVLFDGENLDHWRSTKNDSFPAEGWVVEDGTLVLDGKGGDIITREKYGDFELTWEFNLTKEANSGIKYFVDSLTHQETGQVSFNGPEFQIIDDSNHEAIKDDPNGLSSTASLYLLYAPENKTLKPAGEWNEARIVAKDGQVEHWLNGTKVLSYQRGSTEFLERMADTKFKDYPDYGQAREGHILITDHQDRVFFRNMRIRRL